MQEDFISGRVEEVEMWRPSSFGSRSGKLDVCAEAVLGGDMKPDLGPPHSGRISCCKIRGRLRAALRVLSRLVLSRL